MHYESIFRQLNRGRVRYLVVGGFAVNLHGYQRTTGDLDVMVDLAPENVLRLVRVLRRLKYRPKVPVVLEELADPEKRRRWEKEKGMLVFPVSQLGSDFHSLDIMIATPLPFELAYRRRVMVKGKDLRIPVVSVPDLIRMKQISGRDLDLLDISVLKKILSRRKKSALRSDHSECSERKKGTADEPRRAET